MKEFKEWLFILLVLPPIVLLVNFIPGWAGQRLFGWNFEDSRKVFYIVLFAAIISFTFVGRRAGKSMGAMLSAIAIVSLYILDLSFGHLSFAQKFVNYRIEIEALVIGFLLAASFFLCKAFLKARQDGHLAKKPF